MMIETLCGGLCVDALQELAKADFSKVAAYSSRA